MALATTIAGALIHGIAIGKLKAREIRKDLALRVNIYLDINEGPLRTPVFYAVVMLTSTCSMVMRTYCVQTTSTVDYDRCLHSIEFVAPLGLYYYKARMYSPTLGRFDRD